MLLALGVGVLAEAQRDPGSFCLFFSFMVFGPHSGILRASLLLDLHVGIIPGGA